MEILYILDDDREFLTDTVSALVKRGSEFDEIKVFNDVEAFLEYMHPGVWAVVVDFFMPKMNGDEVIPKIKAIEPDCMIILVSGNPEDQLPIKFVRENYMEYVCKSDKEFIQKIIQYTKKHLGFIRFKLKKLQA